MAQPSLMAETLAVVGDEGKAEGVQAFMQLDEGRVGRDVVFGQDALGICPTSPSLSPGSRERHDQPVCCITKSSNMVQCEGMALEAVFNLMLA